MSLLLQTNLLFSLPLLVLLLYFAGGLLHNLLMEGEYQQQGAGGGELVEGTQNIAYAFPPCLAGLQREQVEGTHEQGEQQDAWVYTPEVPGEDLVEVVQQLVGNDVEGESLEYAGHTQNSTYDREKGRKPKTKLNGNSK
ncbi:hypothetical protein EDD16DRAFT_1520845 [Pisolithus croceorrhizus]|nr:hypothetical protein EDD16DRAFT_1520845 [Pisolithus croceorrhizus]